MAASVVLDVAIAAADGCAAAQALLPFLPRVLLARAAPIGEQIERLMSGRVADAPPSTATGDPVARYCHRLRGALQMGDIRSVCRLLDDGPVDASVSNADARAVLDLKFPRKLDGELAGGPRAEFDWERDARILCGGRPLAITAGQLVRWARAKRDRAADAGGWSGRLLLELHAVDAAVTRALARAWSMDPAAWVHRGGAAATWRLLRGSFIPQPTKPLPRPVATASLPRRAWGLSAVRRIRDAATGYCEERGQFGLSGAAGQSAYALAARVLAELGADIVADDRANSFHELHRQAIFGGVDAFLAGVASERREGEGSVLVQLMARTLVGDEPSDATGMPRSVYTFASQPSRTHHALCQGSSESSLLEALAYAQGGWRDVVRGVRCELHDDGYTAVLPDAGVDLLRRPPATDGSRIAEGKDRCMGPRAADIVSRGLSREAAEYLMIAGVPVGDTLAGLTEWRGRYTRRLARLRELADGFLAAGR